MIYIFALITGASSGIGKDMAIYLSKLGYDIIAVGRNKERLEDLKESVNTKLIIITKDLANIENSKELYNEIKEYDVDIFINNAGIGSYGDFDKTDLEIDMLNINIISMHILFKLILKDMIKKDKGYILNVSSIACFMPGPLMASYYASKAYVTRLSESVITELKKQKSNVSISILCPGPINTKFNDKLDIKFGNKALSSEYVSKYAIDNMFKNKKYIIPGFKNKLAKISSNILSNNLLSNMVYNIQSKKSKK